MSTLLINSLILPGLLRHSGMLFLGQSHLRFILESLDPVHRTGKLADAVCNLSTANETDYDGGSDNEREDEAVGAVP